MSFVEIGLFSSHACHMKSHQLVWTTDSKKSVCLEVVEKNVEDTLCNLMGVYVKGVITNFS